MALRVLLRFVIITTVISVFSAISASSGSAEEVRGQGSEIQVTDSTRFVRSALQPPGADPQGVVADTAPAPVTAEDLAIQFCASPVIATLPEVIDRICKMFFTPPPAQPGAPAAPPPPSAADVAQSWSRTATLPNPKLTVPPGHAVTGLTAYLEISTPSPWTVAIPDPIRNNTISVSCGHTSFDVDWGDGTPMTHTSSTGGPYPRGDVTHDFQEATPSDTIVVTEHWGCRWSNPLGAGGQLTGLRSTGQLALEVREIQSTN
ncbi:MAG: hypothetical protein NVS3B12_23310 [Acidimicrobiales bacterium]